MINSIPDKLPLYLKLSQIIMGLVAVFFVLYIGKQIIVPLIFATIIAILLNPVVNYLCGKRVNRVVAIAIALLIAIVVITFITWFLTSQIARFSDSLPLFKQKFVVFLTDVENWVGQTLNIPKEKLDARIASTRSEMMSGGTDIIGQVLGTIGGLFVFLFLLPVYTFMILFYKPLLLQFIAELFPNEKHKAVAEVLVETKSLIQNYLIGLLIEAALVATLNSASLLVLGIQYAILIGVIGAILNVIPYIGGLIAISIPMLIAFATKSPITALWVFIAYLVVQFIDNQFFVPKIVASKVKINALVSIIVVLIGSALWGVAGMFLSIPLTAIIKVIFDKVTPMKPFGFLLGDNQPDIGKMIFDFKYPTRKRKVIAK